ncbi:MAG TPA: hypothetical protein VNA89_06740 [Gemmatimonadaceae bacterium]|nr:hypothetical protein [Gemmatimonadaceae bacterium]
MRWSCAALASVVLGTGAVPRPAGAQAADVGCRSGSALLENACQVTADLYQYLAPQLAAAVSVGSPLLGGAAPGGQRWSLGGRLAIVDATLPELSMASIDTGRATPADFPLVRVPLPMPSLEGSLRLPLPGARRWGGSLDLLASVHAMPRVRTGGATVGPDGLAARFGLGARLGIATGWRRVHTVAFSAFERGLPRLTATGVSGGDTVELRALQARVRGWRLTAAAHAAGLDIEAGGGADFAGTEAQIFVALSPDRCLNQATCRGEPFSDGFRQRLLQSHLFLSAARRAGGVTWGGEVGMASGSGTETFNTFGGSRTSGTRWRAAFGVRVGG